LWTDELASVQFAGQPLHQLWSGWMVNETNPPLYYTLLHGWMAWFGPSEADIRSLSLVAGMGVVALVLVLGNSMFGRPEALLAGVFVAISCTQVAYSQEARAGIFTQLSSLVALAGAARFVAVLRPSASVVGSVRWLSVYALGCLSALYLHTTMFTLPLLVNGFVLAAAARRRAWNGQMLAWIAVNLACMAGWSWWIWITIQQLHGGAAANISWIPKPGLRALLAVTGHIYGAVTLGPVAAVIMGLAALLIGRFIWLQEDRSQAGLLATVVAGVPLVLWALSQRTPVLMERTVLWTQAPFLLLLAAALINISPGRSRMAAIGLALAVLLVDTVGWEARYGKEPWRDAIALIVSQARPADAILVMTPPYGGAVEHYVHQLNSALSVIAVDDGRPDGRWGASTFKGLVIAPQDLPHLLNSHPRIWVLERGTTTPRPLLQGLATELRSWPINHRNATPLLVSVWASMPSSH
jgi:uncharacterized membrane protein